MANEYINRDAVIELLVEKQRAICPCGRLGRGYVYGSDRDKYDEIEADIDKVQNIPAADVVERKHGKWKKHYADHEAFGVRPFFRYCSKCNEATIYPYNFCPNCGADMRELNNG